MVSKLKPKFHISRVTLFEILDIIFSINMGVSPIDIYVKYFLERGKKKIKIKLKGKTWNSLYPL